MKASVLVLVSAFLATALAAPVADPKVINPYQNEIDAADPKAVLGDLAKRGKDNKIVYGVALVNVDEKAKRGEDAASVIVV
ncbi:MAG: hypothetical protein M1813_009620 [Trichoglossum hirsutum]|nr:MAG: hypothetical protein M1813_009620 [Trichoglossum hirsutum]